MTYDPKRKVDLTVARQGTGFGGFFTNESAAVTSDFVGVVTAGVVLSVALASTVTDLVTEREVGFTSYVSEVRKTDDVAGSVEIADAYTSTMMLADGNGNNGHGNDADGNDDSNPGASNDADDYTDDDGVAGTSSG
jgi:hypothetical protein